MPWLLGSALYLSFQRLTQHLFVSNISTRLAMTVGVCTVFTFQRLIQHLFVSNISTRLAMTVGVCTGFILSKTNSISVCLQNFHKTCPDCTVFIISKTYSTCVCHQNFHKTCHDCWGLYCCHHFNYLFNICLSPTFLQDWPWLLGSALYSSLQRLIQHLFVYIIPTRLAMTVGVCTIFIISKSNSTSVNIISIRLAITVGICTVSILSKTYSTSVCQYYFHKTYHDCMGLYCIHHF